MKKIILSMIIFLLISLPFASADMYDELDKRLEKFNKDFEPVPKIFKKFLGNQRINMEFELDNGSIMMVGIIMENAQITSIEENTLENPSVNVYVKENKMMKIIKSDDPVMNAYEAIKNKEIKYEFIGFKNKLKVFIFGGLLKIASLTSNLFKKNG